MWLWSLVLFLFFAGFAGWIAAKIVYGRGKGLVLNTGAGVFGYFLGQITLGLLGGNAPDMTSIFIATVGGAIVVMFAIKYARSALTNRKEPGRFVNDRAAGG